MNILDFNKVSFAYEHYEPTILDLSFSIDRPKSVSIIGSSGCGKTTIFKLILSLLAMQDGQILYKGQDIKTLKSYAGYMPQKDLLFPWKNIEKNLSVPLDIQGVSKEEKKEKIQTILEKMNLLDIKNKFPYQLSGGMRQRISFARTILTDSDLLLFDEPLSALDYITRVSMQEWLLEELSQFENKTAIFITHDIQEAIFLSDEILIVKDTPITTLEKVLVDLPKKRTRDMLDEKNMVELKKYILSVIKKDKL